MTMGLMTPEAQSKPAPGQFRDRGKSLCYTDGKRAGYAKAGAEDRDQTGDLPFTPKT